MADPTHVHQVLMNIAINARDAMPEGGTLTIEAANVVLAEKYARMNVEASPGRYVLVNISDTGTGMSKRVLERIFDPFFTTKEIGKGTGLGLSTALTIVNSIGGFLNAYSEPGKGSKFSIYFPAAETEQSTEAGDESSSLPRGNGETLLIIDDEVNIREVMKATLETFGYRVITAADGKEGLAQYVQRGPEIALVISDMAMPAMDGAAMIRALRKLDPEVRVIGMSGLLNTDQSAELQSLNVNAFLSKPFTSESLLTTIARSVKDSTSQDRPAR
jgi:CheY-like chemotaxis protein